MASSCCKLTSPVSTPNLLHYAGSPKSLDSLLQGSWTRLLQNSARRTCTRLLEHRSGSRVELPRVQLHLWACRVRVYLAPRVRAVLSRRSQRSRLHLWTSRIRVSLALASLARASRRHRQVFLTSFDRHWSTMVFAVLVVENKSPHQYLDHESCHRHHMQSCCIIMFRNGCHDVCCHLPFNHRLLCLSPPSIQSSLAVVLHCHVRNGCHGATFLNPIIACCVCGLLESNHRLLCLSPPSMQAPLAVVMSAMVVTMPPSIQSSLEVVLHYHVACHDDCCHLQSNFRCNLMFAMVVAMACIK
jgi:hypothetical protein